MALTTTKRVFHRAGLSDKDIDPDDMLEFIEDAQAFIEAKSERVFVATDTDFNLARSACTDLTAFYALIRILGGVYSGLQWNEDELDIATQQRSKLELATKLRTQARDTIALLEPRSPILRARSTTS